LGREIRRRVNPFKQWWSAVVHGLEPREIKREAAQRLAEYGQAKLAGRLNWTFAQITSVDLQVALLCERVGWQGVEGFERLQNTPVQAVTDWLAIAELEKEKERRARN